VALQLARKSWPCKCNQKFVLSLLGTPSWEWITKTCYNLSFTRRCYLGNCILCSYDEVLKMLVFPVYTLWLIIEILFVGLQILLSNCFAVARCREKWCVDFLWFGKVANYFFPMYGVCLYRDSRYFRIILFMVLKVKCVFKHAWDLIFWKIIRLLVFL